MPLMPYNVVNPSEVRSPDSDLFYLVIYHYRRRSHRLECQSREMSGDPWVRPADIPDRIPLSVGVVRLSNMDPILGSLLGFIGLLQLATLTYVWQTNRRIDEANAETNRRFDEMIRVIHETNEATNRRIDETNEATNRKIDETNEATNRKIDETNAATNRKIDDLAKRFGPVEQRVAHLEGRAAATSRN